MNKLYRYILVGILALIPCFSHAYFECDKSYISSMHVNNGYTWSQNLGNGFADVGGDIFCMVGTEAGFSVSEQCDGNYDISVGVRESYCITAAESTSNLCFKSNGVGILGRYWFDTSCLTQPYTSLVCQTKYNLIPIEDVTANYCKLNFNLINPSECPISGGTGAINRSSLFINGTQYPGNTNISVYIPEYIARSITYNDNENIVDIEGYNADTDYIENVINNEKLTPSNEDFTLLLQGLVNFIPYLFIGLLILRFVKILNKVWK